MKASELAAKYLQCIKVNLDERKTLHMLGFNLEWKPDSEVSDARNAIKGLKFELVPLINTKIDNAKPLLISTNISNKFQGSAAN